MSFTNSCFGFAAQGNTEEADVGPKEEAADALVLQKVVTKAARQKARSCQAARDIGDISELFEDSEDEAGPEVETRAFRRPRVIVIESFESESELEK